MNVGRKPFAKKSFGQHFLKDARIAEMTADAMLRTDEYATVFEVGPGRGALTQHLLDRPYDLICIEADEDMVQYLHSNYTGLKIVEDDFLKTRLDLLAEAPFAVIGNFPYNISSQILIKMVDNRDAVIEMVGMFQKELGQRVAAKEGSKIYGKISVMVQAYFEVEYLFDVGAQRFDPPPNVTSCVIRLNRSQRFEPMPCDFKSLKRTVHAAFGMRRKMMRNSLKGLLGDRVNELPERILTMRPEQLSVQGFIELATQVDEIINQDKGSYEASYDL